MVRVVENQLRCLETNAVVTPVRAVLFFVPGPAHGMASCNYTNVTTTEIIVKRCWGEKLEAAEAAPRLASFGGGKGSSLAVLMRAIVILAQLVAIEIVKVIIPVGFRLNRCGVRRTQGLGESALARKQLGGERHVAMLQILRLVGAATGSTYARRYRKYDSYCCLYVACSTFSGLGDSLDAISHPKVYSGARCVKDDLVVLPKALEETQGSLRVVAVLR